MIFERTRSVKDILSTIADEISDICASIESTGILSALENCSEAESVIQELISKRRFSAEEIAKAFDKVIYELSNAISDVVQKLTEEIYELYERTTRCNGRSNS